jgi:hypothetical protein
MTKEIFAFAIADGPKNCGLLQTVLLWALYDFQNKLHYFPFVPLASLSL